MRRFQILPVLLVVGCGPAPSEPATPTHTPERTPQAAPQPSPQPTLAATPEAQQPSTPVEPEGPSACPEGMQLVEGEYCTEVEQKCIKKWFDKSNKKTVCEQFEPPSVCVGKKVRKRFCMDTYAWPNVKGERPEVMNRFHQAQLKCAAIGKRLCTETEWTFACEGPEMKPFPHGFTRDTTKCHGDMPWDQPKMRKVARRDPKELERLWQGVRSGSQPECISDFGVADLPGNNDEIVANEQRGGGWRAKFDSVHSGGPWYKGVRNQCRPKIYTHDEGFYYYFLGFRCCAEPDGAKTSPLTPYQRKKGWDIERIERIAGSTLDEVKEKLELKKQGKCSCRPKDIQCKTLCGTLLPEDTRDAPRPGTPADKSR